MRHRWYTLLGVMYKLVLRVSIMGIESPRLDPRILELVASSYTEGGRDPVMMQQKVKGMFRS